MIEAWNENGDLIRIGNAGVAAVVRERSGRVLVKLMGGRTLVAAGDIDEVMAMLRAEDETMHRGGRLLAAAL